MLNVYSKAKIGCPALCDGRMLPVEKYHVLVRITPLHGHVLFSAQAILHYYVIVMHNGYPASSFCIGNITVQVFTL
jgi:hypothetical protein